ncbi:hypothetical protein [Persephonella sp.]
MKVGNDRGMALLTTLILGFVALAVVAALMTFMIFGKKTSVIEERYTSALEAAKGAAYYIMSRLAQDKNLTNDSERTICYGTDTSCPCYRVIWDTTENKLKCPDGKSVDRIELGSYSTIGDYNITAILKHKESTVGGYDIYAIRVISTKAGTTEKAEIDFIYRTSPP